MLPPGRGNDPVPGPAPGRASACSSPEPHSPTRTWAITGSSGPLDIGELVNGRHRTADQALDLPDEEATICDWHWSCAQVRDPIWSEFRSVSTVIFASTGRTIRRGGPDLDDDVTGFTVSVSFTGAPSAVSEIDRRVVWR